MSSALFAARAALSAHHPSQLTHASHLVAAKLPRPKKNVTVPVIVVAALLALIAIVRKLIALALLAVIICVGFVAYQSGALNHWVDKGKQSIEQDVKPTPGS